MNRLAAFLLDDTECDKIAARLEAGFLLELTNRRCEQVFARLDLAFWNAPVAVVFVFEKRPARMREENLQPTVAYSIHQQPRADFVLSFHDFIPF